MNHHFAIHRLSPGIGTPSGRLCGPCIIMHDEKSRKARWRLDLGASGRQTKGSEDAYVPRPRFWDEFGHGQVRKRTGWIRVKLKTAKRIESCQSARERAKDHETAAS